MDHSASAIPAVPAGLARSKRHGDNEGADVNGRDGSKKRQALSTVTNGNGSSTAVGESGVASGAPRPGKRVTRSMSKAGKLPHSADNGVPGSAMEVDHGSGGGPAMAYDYDDIDEGDTDPHVVVEYVDEIYRYLRALEGKFRPKPQYMAKQKDINHSMRTILVDWLVEVAEEYKLNSHTLYIAVGYIDRFLSEMSVQRGKLQLVGVTAMLLASKYEEIYPPAVDEFVYITDNTYTREQILKMENLVLKVLQFDMGAVTAYSFAERFLKAAHCQPHDQIRYLTLYLMELTLQDGERYLKYRPSVIAAAAVCISLHSLNRPHWTPTLQHYSELTLADIADCVEDIHHTFFNAADGPQQAVREKYSEDKFMSVARLVPCHAPPITRGAPAAPETSRTVAPAPTVKAKAGAALNPYLGAAVPGVSRKR